MSSIDLTPDTLDLQLYAGDGSDFQVTFEDESSQPIDISSYAWMAEIRKTRGSDVSYPLEITTVNGPGGVIQVHISAVVTRELSKYSVWDLQCVQELGTDPVTIFQGRVTCNEDVTRAEVLNVGDATSIPTSDNLVLDGA